MKMLNKHRHTHVLFATVSGWLVGWFHAAKYNTYYLFVCTHKTISIVENKRYEEREPWKKRPKHGEKKTHSNEEKNRCTGHRTLANKHSNYFSFVTHFYFDENVYGNLRNKILYLFNVPSKNNNNSKYKQLWIFKFTYALADLLLFSFIMKRKQRERSIKRRVRCLEALLSNYIAL